MRGRSLQRLAVSHTTSAPSPSGLEPGLPSQSSTRPGPSAPPPACIAVRRSHWRVIMRAARLRDWKKLTAGRARVLLLVLAHMTKPTVCLLGGSGKPWASADYIALSRLMVTTRSYDLSHTRRDGRGARCAGGHRHAPAAPGYTPGRPAPRPGTGGPRPAGTTSWPRRPSGCRCLRWLRSPGPRLRNDRQSPGRAPTRRPSLKHAVVSQGRRREAGHGSESLPPVRATPSPQPRP